MRQRPAAVGRSFGRSFDTSYRRGTSCLVLKSNRMRMEVVNIPEKKIRHYLMKLKKN